MKNNNLLILLSENLAVFAMVTSEKQNNKSYLKKWNKNTFYYNKKKQIKMKNNQILNTKVLPLIHI